MPLANNVKILHFSSEEFEILSFLGQFLIAYLLVALSVVGVETCNAKLLMHKKHECGGSVSVAKKVRPSGHKSSMSNSQITRVDFCARI
jgi:hypothetical protein